MTQLRVGFDTRRYFDTPWRATEKKHMEDRSARGLLFHIHSREDGGAEGPVGTLDPRDGADGEAKV